VEERKGFVREGWLVGEDGEVGNVRMGRWRM
jgi:hypothetical protein